VAGEALRQACASLDHAKESLLFRLQDDPEHFRVLAREEGPGCFLWNIPDWGETRHSQFGLPTASAKRAADQAIAGSRLVAGNEAHR
jgi:hypothetical protein